MPEPQRVSLAKCSAFGDSTFDFNKKFNKQELTKISNGIKAYKESVNDLQKDIDIYDKKIYQFITLLENTKPEIVRNTHETRESVSFSTNIDIINLVLDNSINIILDKADLVLLQQTGKFQGSLRGKLSPNAKGTMNKNHKIK